jgi:hypothetical protein
LIGSVSQAIDNTESELHKKGLQVQQVELKVQTKTEYDATVGFSLDLVIGFLTGTFGDTVSIKQDKTQTLNLTLKRGEVSRSAPIPSNDLIKGIEAISQAAASASLPGFVLKEAKVELDFELQIDNNGNISFVIVATGSASKDNINSITITLGKYEPEGESNPTP